MNKYAHIKWFNDLLDNWSKQIAFEENTGLRDKNIGSENISQEILNNLY